MGVASLSKMVKPALLPKKCSKAGGRLPGVEEDGAVGKCIQEHERPWQTGGVIRASQRWPKSNNRWACLSRESERPIVATKRVMTVEPRGRSGNMRSQKEQRTD